MATTTKKTPVAAQEPEVTTTVDTTTDTSSNPFLHTDVRNLVRQVRGISCEVKFVSKPDYLQFLATPDDVETHGQTIYQECDSGKWGDIADYYPTDEELLFAAQDRISRELGKANTEVTVYQDLVDIDDATPADVAALKAWKTYRVGLNRVPSQAGYPTSITWPVSP